MQRRLGRITLPCISNVGRPNTANSFNVATSAEPKRNSLTKFAAFVERVRLCEFRAVVPAAIGAAALAILLLIWCCT